jgi:formylglycine-generating enzyme required for sulfatase activity
MNPLKLTQMLPLIMIALIAGGCGEKKTGEKTTATGKTPTTEDTPEDAKAPAAPPKDLTLDLGGGVTMKLVLIPAGEFMMGSRDTAEEVARKAGLKAKYNYFFKREHPQHRVRITKAFYMGIHEVTVAQYKQFVSETKYRTEAEAGDGGYVLDPKKSRFVKKADANWRNPYLEQGDDHPVVLVSWNDCQRFVRWAAGKTGKKMRLPTEAEWEYACRAGTTTPFHTGETISTDQANYNGGNIYADGSKGIYRQKTTPVGSFTANSRGLYDMPGNIAEWCSDWCVGDFYQISPNSDPTGPTDGGNRALRGGGWSGNPVFCRSAYRGRVTPGFRYDFIGFRVVLPAAPGL